VAALPIRATVENAAVRPFPREKSIMEVQPAAPERSGFAIASLVLGVVSLCAWLLPICGVPISLVAVVLGALSLNSPRRGMAIAGIVLGAIAILLSLVNAALGAYFGVTDALNLQGLP
jgi:hypothetical protein